MAAIGIRDNTIVMGLLRDLWTGVLGVVLLSAPVVVSTLILESLGASETVKTFVGMGVLTIWIFSMGFVLGGPRVDRILKRISFMPAENDSEIPKVKPLGYAPSAMFWRWVRIASGRPGRSALGAARPSIGSISEDQLSEFDHAGILRLSRRELIIAAGVANNISLFNQLSGVEQALWMEGRSAADPQCKNLYWSD